MAEKKLARSTNKMIGGVCAGLAEYLGIDTTAMRVAYVIASFFFAIFPFVVLYIILLFVMPEKPEANRVEDAEFKDVTKKEDK